MEPVFQETQQDLQAAPPSRVDAVSNVTPKISVGLLTRTRRRGNVRNGWFAPETRASGWRGAPSTPTIRFHAAHGLKAAKEMLRAAANSHGARATIFRTAPLRRWSWQ